MLILHKPDRESGVLDHDEKIDGREENALRNKNKAQINK